MVKDVTPLPDQDVIHLDIARAKICSKIDLSDAYEQIHIIPEDVHKTVFTTIYRTILCPIEIKKDEPIWVICNASIYGVGVMDGQGETWQTCRPAGFMSRKFMDAQRHY